MSSFSGMRTFIDNFFTARKADEPSAGHAAKTAAAPGETVMLARTACFQEGKVSTIEENILIAQERGDHAKVHQLKEQLEIQMHDLAFAGNDAAVERVKNFQQCNR